MFKWVSARGESEAWEQKNTGEGVEGTVMWFVELFLKLLAMMWEKIENLWKKASLTAVVFDWVESTQILRNFNSQLKQTTIPASEKLSNICTWFNPNRGSDTLRLIIVWQASDRILEVRFSVTATNSTDKVKLDDFNRKPLSLNHSQNSLSWSWVLNYVL